MNNKGYGLFGYGQLAHRLMWEFFHGDIASGMFICHHCDNRKCVRPDHLYLGTPADNARDMRERGRAFNGRRDWTHCKAGHALTDDNVTLYQHKSGRIWRKCRECNRKYCAARRRSAAA